MSNTDTINLRDFFSLPLKEAKALFEKLVLDPRPLEPGEMVCPKCNGVGICKHCDDGNCPECEGNGRIDHDCDCEFCKQNHEDCNNCNGTGDCPKCHGDYKCSFCNTTGRVSDKELKSEIAP